MKASVKLRDEQEPLVRAKIPLSILGMPICSGVTMGCSHELGLHVYTLFGAGPSCRVTFLPNDSHTPLCVMLKAGLGAWGSPKGSCLVFSAQLKLPTTLQQRPSFSFCIKPRLGDFSLCKDWRGIELPRRGESGKADEPSAASSIITPASVSVAELAKVFDNRREEQHKTLDNNKNKAGSGFYDDWEVAEAGGGAKDKAQVGLNAASAAKGWNVLVNSSLPLLGQRVCARIKWRMEFPCCYLVDTLASHPHKLFTRSSLPVLTVDKLSLQHHTETQITKTKQHQQQQYKSLKLGTEGAGDTAAWIQEEDQELHKVTSMCATLRRQLHLIYSENQVLKSTMEEVRSNFNNTRMSPTNSANTNHESAPEDSRRRSNKTQPSSKEPAAAGAASNSSSNSVAEELKRAIATTKSSSRPA